MSRLTLGITLLVLVSTLAFGQSAPATLTFEVASVKPAPPPTANGIRVRMGGDAGRLDYANVTLKDCIRMAYRVKDYQISGPDWLTSQRYDLVAKLPEGATRDQVPEMLQALLAERFKLKLHRDTKDQPIYALVLAKNGPKFKPSEPIAAGPDGRPGPGPGGPGGPRGMMQMGRGQLEARQMTVSNFADLLARFVDRPVVDMTDLKGNYDFKLEYTPDPRIMQKMMPGGGTGPGGPPPAAAPEGGSDSGPSIFTAVQEQLGLKLEGRKAPVELLVIDQAEKVPTEN